MRRKDREITDLDEIMAIIRKCDVCSLALFDSPYPYIVPLNFGAEKSGDKIFLYFHGANAGKKLGLLQKNPAAAFEMNCSRKLLTGETACDATMEFESVCGNGHIEVLGSEEKIHALQILMNQYTGDTPAEFSENLVAAVAVCRLTVHEITGKRLKKK